MNFQTPRWLIDWWEAPWQCKLGSHAWNRWEWTGGMTREVVQPLQRRVCDDCGKLQVCGHSEERAIYQSWKDRK